MLWHLGREVKAADSKSAGLCPRRFESCRCRSNIFGEIFLPKNFFKLSGVFDFNNYKEIFSGVFDFNNQQTNFLEFLILTIYKEILSGVFDFNNYKKILSGVFDFNNYIEILSGVFDFNNYKEILSGVFDFNNKKKSKCLEWGSNPRLHRRIELKSTALDHSAIEAGT